MTEQNSQTESLRPQAVGDLIDATFRQYRSDFAFLMRVSIYVLLPFQILQSIVNFQSTSNTRSTIQRLMSTFLQSSPRFHSMQPLSQHAAPTTPEYIVSTLILGLAAIFVYPVVFGAILHRTARQSLYKEGNSLGKCLRYSARRFFPTIFTNLFAWIITSISMAVFWAVAVIPIAVLSNIHATLAITIPLGILLVLGAILATIWVFTRLSMTSSVVREEKRIFWPAMARSWVLTRRNFWRTLGFLALITLMIGIIQGAIMGLSSLLPSVIALIVTGIATLFTAPFQMLAISNLYVDLRVRTDGLDMRNWLNDTADSEEA